MTKTVHSAGNLATRQAVTGVVPPQEREVVIRTAYPALNAYAPGLGKLIARLVGSVFLAPLGWALLLPLFGMRLAPVFMRRYALTNQRVKTERGWKRTIGEEVRLADIDAVQVDDASYSPFFRAGDVEIVSAGKTVLRLTSVPEPESFRRAILIAVTAWVPGKAAQLLPAVPRAE